MAHVAAVSGVIGPNRASTTKSAKTKPNKYEFSLTEREKRELLPVLKKTEYSNVRALGPTYTYDAENNILSPRSAQVTATIKEYRKKQELELKAAKKTAKTAKPPSRLRSFFTIKRKSTTAGGRKRRQRRRTRKHIRRR
jgi:hypothetical protein